jgi:hypothetical protein
MFTSPRQYVHIQIESFTYRTRIAYSITPMHFRLGRRVLIICTDSPPIYASIYSLPFYKIIVPTIDTIRYDYIINVLLLNGFPILLMGPVGTGKTSIIQCALDLLDETEYVILFEYMSAQTTSNNVQVRLHAHRNLPRDNLECIVSIDLFSLSVDA